MRAYMIVKERLLKKHPVAIALIAVLTLASSCVSVSVPGKDSGIVVNLEPKAYSFAGDVMIEGTVTSILGLITWGGATYYDLLQKAREMYGADDVINVTLDTKTTMFFGLYIAQTYVLHGMAITYE